MFHLSTSFVRLLVQVRMVCLGATSNVLLIQHSANPNLLLGEEYCRHLGEPKQEMEARRRKMEERIEQLP